MDFQYELRNGRVWDGRKIVSSTVKKKSHIYLSVHKEVESMVLVKVGPEYIRELVGVRTEWKEVGKKYTLGSCQKDFTDRLVQ